MRNKNWDAEKVARFRTLYVAFAEAMLEATSKKCMDANAEGTLVRDFQFSGGEYTLSKRHDPARERFMPSPDDDAFPHAIANECADAFFSSGLASGFRLSDDAGTPIENPGLEKLRPFIIHMELSWPIQHLIRRHGRTSFSRRQVLACLDRYITHWKGEAATDPELAPVYNLDTGIRTIKLDELVSIVHFTDEEKASVMNALAPLEHAIDVRNYAGAYHAAKLRPIDGSCDEDAKREIGEHARKALQCAITTLRLMKPEGIGTMGYIRIRGLTRHLGAGFGPLEDFDLPWNWRSRFRNRYVLDRADLPRFRRLYKMLSGKRFKTWDGLELLLRQFNRSCRRERDEDRIVDYAICLESALLSGVRVELSYRLALRAAKLLRDQRNPKQTFEHMQCLYNVRGKIVHANKSLGSAAVGKEITKRVHLKPHDFMQSTDTLMREVLSKTIERVSRGERPFFWRSRIR